MGQNKIQTNDKGINTLVETQNSRNSNYWYGNFIVEIEKVLTDDEIKEKFQSEASHEEIIEIAKNWIKKKAGYAISNVNDEILNIEINSIVAFKE